jgi:N utilization substance protein A
MPVTFDTETIRMITLFENITGAPVKDCLIEENTLYLVVDEGKVGIAIGKNGNSVKHA